MPHDPASPSAPHPESTPRLTATHRLVIGILLVAAFVVILNETIMGVALPRLMDELGITASMGQWLTTAYMLTMAVVIPITGFLLQRFHTRPVFLVAMSLFTLGTAVAAAAPGFGVLLVGRVVQASGTAIMMPLLMTTVMTLVPEQLRGRTMGLISVVISVAPALGPTISGIILNAMSWRWLFIFVLPISLTALLLGYWRIANVTSPRRLPIDGPSIALSAFAFGGIVYGLSMVGEGTGGGTIQAVTALAVGSLVLAVFIWRQLRLQREARALLDLRTFRSRQFTLAVVLLSVSMLTMFGTLILVPIYTQSVLGLSTLGSGLLMLPGGLLMGLLGPVIGRLYDAVGPRAIVVPGSVVVSAALWAFAFTGAHTPVWVIAAIYTVFSAGLATMFTPLFTAALGAVEPGLYSHGSAIIGTVQQVGGAAGTALFVSVMTLASARAAGEGLSAVLAVEAGVQRAFVVGAALSLLMVGLAWLVRGNRAAVPGDAAPTTAP